MRKQHSITELKNKFLCLLQVVSNSYFIKAIDRIFYGWVYWRKRPTCGAGVTIKILVNNELYQAFLVVLLRRPFVPPGMKWIDDGETGRPSYSTLSHRAGNTVQCGIYAHFSSPTKHKDELYICLVSFCVLLVAN